MNTKICTSIEQSEKLLELGLSPETADMEYIRLKETNAMIGSVPFVKDDSEVENSAYDAIYERIPCWSLTALLSVLPPIEGFRPIIDLDINLIRYEGNYRDKLCFNENNLVDACYEMILKLYELNLL